MQCSLHKAALQRILPGSLKLSRFFMTGKNKINNIKSSTMTKFRNIIVAAFSLVIFANVTNAQTVKAAYSVSAEEPLKVKYLGDDGEYLLFQVTLNSHESAKGKFTISEKTDGGLYSSAVASNLTVKNIKVAKN